MSGVEELVQQEPWRVGAGQPANALDPTWKTELTARCGGNIKREPGTDWWFCEDCGCCGNHDFAKAHRPINDPVVFFAQSMEEYISKRVAEGVSRELATRQMFHVAGVAIRYAASVKSEDLGDYVRQLVVR